MQHIDTHDSRASSAQESHSAAQAAHRPEFIEGELVEGAPYSGKQLADELAIGESTFRTRWFPWLQKVAPIELLKTEDGYTELARSLGDFRFEVVDITTHRLARARFPNHATGLAGQSFIV